VHQCIDKLEIGNISFDILGSYIAGFVDGEGSFNVSLRKSPDYRLGWQPVLSFNVSQKYLDILLVLKSVFMCGIIKRRKCDGLYSFDITNPKEIMLKVIPFFEKNRLLSTNKRSSFELFKKIAILMANKEHLNESGLLKILQLREDLNPGAGRTRKYSIISVFPLQSSQTIRQASSGKKI
jgi:hypothetical protein